MKKLPLFLLIGAAAPFSRAALLVSENFSGYTAGTAPVTGSYLPTQAVQGGSTGLSGTWASGDAYAWVANTGDLAAPANTGVLADAGGQRVVFSGGATPSAYATVTSPITTVNNTVYVSFVAQLVAGGGLWLQNGAATVLRLGTNNGSNWGISDGTTAQNATGTVSGTASFLVYAITFGASGGANDSVSLFVNPDANGQPGIATATWTGLSLNDSSINRVVVRGGSNNTSNQFDNLRIGTTYADVAAVPEPSTYGLLGAGALGAVSFVRRRRSRFGAR